MTHRFSFLYPDNPSDWPQNGASASEVYVNPYIVTSSETEQSNQPLTSLHLFLMLSLSFPHWTMKVIGLLLVADQKLDRDFQLKQENEKDLLFRLYERVFTRHLFR